MRSVASTVLGAFTLAGIVVFMVAVGWVLLLTRLLAGFAAARGVR